MRPIAAGDRAVASVLKDMNWRRKDVVVSAHEVSTALSNSGCYFFRMHHRLIPSAGVMRLVLDGDGACVPAVVTWMDWPMFCVPACRQMQGLHRGPI